MGVFSETHILGQSMSPLETSRKLIKYSFLSVTDAYVLGMLSVPFKERVNQNIRILRWL